MDQLLALLAGQGPLGVAIGVGAMLLVQWLRSKYPNLPSPTPTPTPSPTPTPLPSDTPLLDALLTLLKQKLTRQSVESTAAPHVKDIDETTANELLNLIAKK